MVQATFRSAYRVGIDLGTTNCVVSYFSLPKGSSRDSSTSNVPTLLPISQVMADGSVQEFTYLPSAIYVLAADEIGKIDPVLPWRHHDKERVVGVGALALGQRRAGQLVQSAKSWLSHRQVDRRAAILPWASEFSKKLSPLEASKVLLLHIKQNWNHRFPDAPLESQAIALTLPASFDEEARALTLEAAKLAGLEDLYLLEEPQAACYHYISDDEKLAALADKKMLLVVDIGGGTSDFSLVAIHPASAKTTSLSLKRVAVGEHLLLGGDNLDQALAFQLDPKQISALSATRLAALVQQTRQAKETLLAENAAESLSITVLGGGSRLIGGSQKFDVSRETLLEQIRSGFFPLVNRDDKVQKSDYAMHTLGLPYESDPAFTRHLAAFLQQHKAVIEAATGTAMPDAVLFNGGLFNSPVLKARLLEQLNAWSSEPILACSADEPNDAVAKGAVMYLNALAGDSTRIESGVAHSLYLKVGEDQFVGILPKDTLKGEVVRLEQEFFVTLGQQVQFPLYRSDDHIDGVAGKMRGAEGLHYISTLMTELDGAIDSPETAVTLSVQMTEVGVLQVLLNAHNQRDQWRLDFSTQPNSEMMGAEKNKDGVGLLHANMGQAEEHLTRCFSSAGQKQSPDLVKSLKQDLDQLLGNRDDWNLATSRRLVDKLLSVKSGRSKSAQHERQWLQLMGYCLRPGFGAADDLARVQQVINATKAGTQFDTAPVWGQYWTLYRRIAGGLSVDQQTHLFKQFSQYYSPTGQRSRDKMKALTTKSSDDLIRLVGALENVSNENKVTTIDWLLKRLQKTSEPDTAWWTIGRIASRHLLSGKQEQRISEDALLPILEMVLKEDWKKRKQAGLAAVLMSQVSVGEADKLSALRKKIANKLKKDKCPAQWLERLESQIEINSDELNALVGESLPIGLRLS
ncbi:hsp70 family protein [Marinomonas sp. M1K-6]|uniref:Hsp70 family protein n=1 Tax=Marinomonas profundi TaxID=2726122 RepID=A0A847R3V4_9GAMM|nr:hsp70 family protein [Marinomonas profundi]NLQ18635.1 hsp70 family protein [Marinomonas profundi]UDV02872.1 hsp70 family protein [Marinomonas profundi]